MSSDVMNIPTGTSNSDDLSDPRSGHDNELRELVYQSLDREGFISRIKAQLRTAVFKTIEKAANPNGTDSRSTLDDSVKGRICRALVLDWLENSQLLYTEDIFKVETSGPKYSAPLTQIELFEQLHITSNQTKSQPILHVLLDQSTQKSPSIILNTLPDFVKQSIDNQFPNEKINDLNRIREHFRSLFSSAFDATVLDAYISKNLPTTSTSLSKHDYEQICLKWMQACANALKSSSAPVQQVSQLASTSLLTAKNPSSKEPKSTPTTRVKSPPSSSSSSSSSSSNVQQKPVFDFLSPTTQNTNTNALKKASDIIPPPLIDLDDSSNSGSSNDGSDKHDTSASVFSKRNATAAELEKLKQIDVIVQDNSTPRTTRSIVRNTAAKDSKDLLIEYDDESISHSVTHSIISSVDDITVDKVSSTPSALIDYFDDFDKN